jgi:hypothetical protein
MPATRVQLTLPDGLDALFCPACGEPVYDGEEGPAAETCEHVRFIIDAEGELSIAEPEGMDADEEARQERILALVEQTESWDDFLGGVTRLLPASVVIMEFADEPGGEDDEPPGQVVVAFDLATPTYEDEDDDDEE